MQPISPHHFLSKNSRVYSKLDGTNQKRFQKRVKKFIKEKDFQGKGFELSQEDMYLISSIAITLTWGFELYTIAHFKKIIVYPEKYYSNFTGTTNKGEVHSRGTIVLSLEDVYEGAKTPDDGYNVALHEFAHALSLNRIFGENDNCFYYFYDKWELQTKALIREKNSFDGLIRNYAFANKHEFFAVMIELFFEQPESLQNKAPELFQSLVYLLNSNPLSPNRLDNKIISDKQRGSLNFYTKKVYNPFLWIIQAIIWPTSIFFKYKVVTDEDIDIFSANKLESDVQALLFFVGLYLFKLPFTIIRYFISYKNFELYDNEFHVRYFFLGFRRKIRVDQIMAMDFNGERKMFIKTLGKKTQLRPWMNIKLVNTNQADLQELLTVLHKEHFVRITREGMPIKADRFSFHK